MRAWFVSSPGAMEAALPGGVQLCSREFLEIVQAGFSKTRILKIGHSRSLMDRLHQRLHTSPYRLFSEREFSALAQEEIASHGKPTVVFLNMCETTRLAKVLKAIDPSIRAVLLSHGPQSGDDLYEASGPGGKRRQGASAWWARWKLGADLCLESEYRRQYLDGVGVMSEEEQVLERWLGTQQTFFLPRLVHFDPLEPRPVEGRAGYVGTLNHTPNLVALERTLQARQNVSGLEGEVRIVGGPPEFGRDFEARYRGVRYLGPLNAAELRKEAASWSLFLNPIYWLAKGASMKLAQALAWKIPFLSTRSGARGYVIPGLENWITEDRPEKFVERWQSLMIRGAEARGDFDAAWEQSQKLWPDAGTVGSNLREWLRL